MNDPHEPLADALWLMVIETKDMLNRVVVLKVCRVESPVRSSPDEQFDQGRHKMDAVLIAEVGFEPIGDGLSGTVYNSTGGYRVLELAVRINV